jgi:hypothetical protein
MGQVILRRGVGTYRQALPPPTNRATVSRMSEVPFDSSAEVPVPAHEGWGPWIRRHPFLTGIAVALLMLVIALNAWVLQRRRVYLEEIDRLRASMSQLERERSDQLVAQEKNKLRLAIALIRRQSRLEGALHLSVALDSGAMFLEREGALLREMPVQVGSERRVGLAPDTVRLAAPRGVRTVSRVIDDTTTWEVPVWVYVERGLAPPADRSFRGSLGIAVILEGGAIIYTQPAFGPLADSTYVLPGAIKARAEDLRAILPNLTSGTRVYFY